MSYEVSSYFSVSAYELKIAYLRLVSQNTKMDRKFALKLKI